jgi:glycosyltransferase involved in cell wall biosynthesis
MASVQKNVMIGRSAQFPNNVVASRSPLVVAAFTPGQDLPGSHFRVRQYLPALAQEGVSVTEYWTGLGAFPPRARWARPFWLAGTLAQRLPHLAKGWTADVSWVYREFVSTLATLEEFTRRPRVIDIDDSVHLFRDGRTARRLAGYADLVVVVNAYLADAWRKYTTSVEIFPMGIDTDRITVTPIPEKPVIGWIGSPSTSQYLKQIAPALQTIARRNPGFAIHICCAQPPDMPELPFVFVPWSAETEQSFLASLTVALLPLDDTPWELGKFSFKALQYMAAGRPCVLSPVGVNSELLAQADFAIAARTPEQWVDAISSLVTDRRAAEQLGKNGRALAVSKYSIAALAPRLAEIFRRLV